MAYTIYKNKNNERIPSCTTIINKNLGWNKEALVAWTRKLALSGIDPRRVKEEAGEIGTLTHKMIEHHIYGAKLDVSKYSFDAIAEATNGLRSYKEWEQEFAVEYLESELKILSESLQWGGTADGIITIGREMVINNTSFPSGSILLLDFKTGKGLYPEHIIQVSAYKNGIEETTSYKLDGIIIVHIHKGDLIEGQKRIETIPIEQSKIELGWKVFKTIRTLHGLSNELSIET